MISAMRVIAMVLSAMWVVPVAALSGVVTPIMRYPQACRCQGFALNAEPATGVPATGVPIRMRKVVFGRLQSLWAQCDEQACRLRQLKPLSWAGRLIPRKRPLNKLNFCEGGTFKVKKDAEGQRRMMVVVAPNAPDACSVQEALDFL